MIKKGLYAILSFDACSRTLKSSRMARMRERLRGQGRRCRKASTLQAVTPQVGYTCLKQGISAKAGNHPTSGVNPCLALV